MKWHMALLCLLGLALTGTFISAEPLYPVESPVIAAPQAPRLTIDLLGKDAAGNLASGILEPMPEEHDGFPVFRVTGSQACLRISEPGFVAPNMKLAWSWKKATGKVCVLQVALRNPRTGQQRYLGYGAGNWVEAPSADPTIEIVVSPDLPREWTRTERNLLEDIRNVLDWDSAQITELYLSPWDGEPGLFAQVVLSNVSAKDVVAEARDAALKALSDSGRGHYMPMRLKKAEEERVSNFETDLEECAPGRNSGANEWSAFGVDSGNKDFNCMGREMMVRYPVFDLVFRLYDGDTELKPGDLDSFRLGLMDNCLPAVWGGWQYDGLLYKVTAMTVPSPDSGNYDLFKLQVQNPTQTARASRLVVGLDGPPDMRVDQGVVLGQGDASFLIGDLPGKTRCVLREWGLCDKRAKAYTAGPSPDGGEPALEHYRVGLDGLPVVYRVKAGPGAKYKVYLAATPHISGYLTPTPGKPGDLIFEYKVEGCSPKTLDWFEYTSEKARPLCVGFDDACDVNGDGYLQIESGVAAASVLRHTRLSVIYVFPGSTPIDSPEAVYRGQLNAQCIYHVQVGITPEQSWNNQEYDKSDVGLARFCLDYDAAIMPGETRTYCLKVPPVHRRQPVSMGYIAHAFRDVLPGEAIPAFTRAQVDALTSADPDAAEALVRQHWASLFDKATRFTLPDPVLTGLFQSRLATRAVLDTKIAEGVYYNPCSPFFYFDHAYRDQAYVVYGYDLAGLHDLAERLLRVYCMDTRDVPPGPVAFDGRPLQLGMLDNGLWNTRPGQFDTQGQNIWALVQHYKLSGRREWLDVTAYPYIARGAQWIVNSRRKHMEEVGNPEDPRYGLIEPGGMEVLEVGKGMHMYYMNAFAILGLREAADAARALGRDADAALFTGEADALKASLRKSFSQTFKRTGLYEGSLWFGVEPEGVGMYGFWAHNCLLWPCRALDPQDPMLTATLRHMERMADTWGGGLHSEGKGSFWPYIGADRAVGYLLRNEPDRTLAYFCAFTDTAGGTFSWGEGYTNLIAGGDQPHMWADAQWVNLFRHLFVMEDASTLMITPAIFRRWTQAPAPVSVQGLPTHFGDLDLTITPETPEGMIAFEVRITPKGDQARRSLDKLLLYPRVAGGREIGTVTCNGTELGSYTGDVIVLESPPRTESLHVEVSVKAGTGGETPDR